VFRDLGFHAETTDKTNDGAVDIVLRKDGKRGAAQCKAWNHSCGVKEVREFYGAVRAEGLDFGYFVSKSGFTESAISFLKKAAIIKGWDIHTLIQQALAHKR
jgi:HJR/Mrr/RecB family endonuclease